MPLAPAAGRGGPQLRSGAAEETERKARLWRGENSPGTLRPARRSGRHGAGKRLIPPPPPAPTFADASEESTNCRNDPAGEGRAGRWLNRGTAAQLGSIVAIRRAGGGKGVPRSLARCSPRPQGELPAASGKGSRKAGGEEALPPLEGPVGEGTQPLEQPYLSRPNAGPNARA